MNKIIIGLMLVLTGCSVVGPGEKGVRITQGKLGVETLDSGWYLWVPFFTSVKAVSTKVQKTEDETEAATKDMQKVTAKIAINWHVDPANLAKMLQTVGDKEDVINQVINPAVSEVLKAATAKMTAEEVLTRRIELKKNIDESLVTRLKNYNVLVDDVSLVNLNFTAEFNHAVESKQIAEQKSKEAEYDAQRAVKEADSEVNRAKGQAEAQRLLKSTITREILQQRAIEKWDGKFPQVMGGNGALPFIDLKMNAK